MTDEFNPAPRLGDRLEEMDKEIRAWAKVTTQHMIKRVLSFNLREKARMQESIGVATKAERNREREARPLPRTILAYLKKNQGDIEKVAFAFARKGIWLEHGVGRGRPVRSPQAQRYARPWLAPTLEPATEELAKILAEEYADIFADELRLLIPGIIDTKINS